MDDVELRATLEDRQLMRRAALGRRDAIPPNERKVMSEVIARSLRTYLDSKSARFLHCYISFRSEVETREFVESELAAGRRVVVPVIEGADGGQLLVHTEVKGLQGLKRGPFGLEEPLERTPASLADLDAVIVPIAAFDRRGTRLGYGKGFYDKFLSELPRDVERIGLAYSMQQLDHIPALPHDCELDTIVTEKEIIPVEHAG
jgi:5-formyltetrahydrofolate cyclo-ligase